MKKTTRSEAAVGITVTVALLLTVYIVVMLADFEGMFAEHQEITVRLPYKVGLRGLNKSSMVNLGGVAIGQVVDTGIEKPDPNTSDSNDVHVYFKMKLPKEYQLRKDCTLISQSNMLGGQVVLAIEDLGSEGDIIKDGETVDLTLADTVMEKLKHEFDPDDPKSLFSKLKKDVPEITDKVLVVVDKIEGTIDTTQETIENIKKITGDERISKIIGSTKSALENIDTITSDDRIGKILDTTQSSMDNIEQLTGDERLDRIVGNLNEVSVDLKLTMQEVRRAPWKLLYKPKPGEYKIQSLVDSAGAFAAGAENLDLTVLRLQRMVEEAGSAQEVDIRQIESMMAQLQASFEKFQQVEDKFWHELK